MGPAGGTLQHPGGATLIVPVGALATTTTLTLSNSDAPTATVLGAAPVGQRFSAGPEGQTFLTPVKLRLPFDPTLLPPGMPADHVVVRMAPHGSSSFVALDSVVDTAAKSVTIATVHFTDFVPCTDPTPLFISTSSKLPGGTASTPYTTPLAATGGVTPYAWSTSLGPTVPPGLSVVPAGQLSGTPTTVGNYAFFLTVADSAGRTVQSAFSMTVAPASNPLPVLSAMSPTTLAAGSPDTTLTVTGTGFVPTSHVDWDGVDLPTTFVSATSLAATIDSGRLAGGGTHAVTVTSTAPGGGTSGALTFTITAPPAPPAITSITPTSLPVSNVATQVTVVGSNFRTTSSVALANVGIPTSFTSSTQLVATIPTAYLASDRTLLVDVYDPPPGGGGYSRTQILLPVGTITSTPTLAAISPRWVTKGAADFTLTLTGSGFVTGAQAYFGPHPLPTTVVDASTARATVPAALVAELDTEPVRLINPAPGGGASAALDFSVGPTAIAWSTLSGAIWTNCGLDGAGSLYCWGANGGTQGNGSTNPLTHVFPTLAAGGAAFDAISVGDHVCALANGDLSCWGPNDVGQVDGSKTTQTRPVALFAGTKFASIAAGRTQSCAITSSGALRCWGSGWGAPGDATNAIAGTFTSVASTQDLVCAIDTAGEAHCYGPNSLGMGSLAGYTFSSISASAWSACGVTTSGDAYCWSNGGTTCALGGAAEGVTTPQLVTLPAGVKVTQVSDGCFSSCLLSTAGDVYCWGRNSHGAMGLGAFDGSTHAPTKVPGLPAMKQVSASGGDWVCGLSTTGARWCWGFNVEGDLGDGTTTASASAEATP